MIALWTFLGRPAARSFVLAMTLSVLSSLLGIALLGLSGWFLAAAAAAGASGASYAFNHLYPSTGVRTIAVGRVASRYAEQLVGHEATLEVSAAIRPLVFERIARAQLGLAALPARDLAVIVDDVGAVEGGFLRVVSPAFGVGAAVLVAIGWVAAVSALASMAVLILFAVACVGAPYLLLRRARAAAVSLASEQGALRSDVTGVVENAIELDVSGVLGAAMTGVNDRLTAGLQAQDRLQAPFRDTAALISLAGGLAALLVIAWAIAMQADGAIAAGASLATLAAFEAASAAARVLDAGAQASASARRLLERLQDAKSAIGGDTVLQSALPLKLDQVLVGVGSERRVGPVSFLCGPGDLVELSGKSGVGKSTVLEAIAALRPIFAGSLTYGGIEQETVRPASVLARVAIAPQIPSFLPGSLREQLVYGRPDASDEAISAALAIVCMTDVVVGRGSDDASVYSGGEQRRLGVARAIIVDPELLLLDEPFAGLEVDLSQRIRVNLARWVGEGRRAIVFTGHQVGPDWAGSPVRRIKWPD